MATTERKYPRTGLRGSPQAFPRKLREVLNDANTKGLYWSKSGEGFVIADFELFARTNTMFPGAAHASFQRQLNLYGFRKVTQGKDAGAYAHPSGNFSRDKPDEVGLIRRHAQPKSGGGGRRRGGGMRRRKSKLAAASCESSDESSDECESFDGTASSDGDEEEEVVMEEEEEEHEVDSSDDDKEEEDDKGDHNESDDANAATDSDESVGDDGSRRRSKRLAAQPKKKKARRHASRPSAVADAQEPCDATMAPLSCPPPQPMPLSRGVSALPVPEAAWLSAALLEERSAEGTSKTMCDKMASAAVSSVCPAWVSQAHNDGLLPSALLRQASVSSDAGWVDCGVGVAAVDAARAAIAAAASPRAVVKSEGEADSVPPTLQRQSSLLPPPAFKFMRSDELLSSFCSEEDEAAGIVEDAEAAGFHFSFSASTPAIVA